MIDIYRSMFVADKEHAREAAFSLKSACVEKGFRDRRTEDLVVAASEILSNALKYANGCAVTISFLQSHMGLGVVFSAVDHGKGIADIDAALAPNKSTSGTLGLGLYAAKKLVDVFDISSSASGTRVSLTKWRG